MTRTRRQSGFTLVELLAASAITVLVAAAAGMTLINVTRAQERVEEQWAVQQEARAGIHAIAAALHNAYRPADGDRNTLEGLDDWAGDYPDSRIRFLTVSTRSLREQHPESDVREVEFFILRDPSGQNQPTLMRRMNPARNEPANEGILERIASGVVGMAIEYHDGRQWVERWSAEADWPLAVQVRLFIAAEGAGPQAMPTSVARVVHLPHRKTPRQAEQGQAQPAGRAP